MDFGQNLVPFGFRHMSQHSPRVYDDPMNKQPGECLWCDRVWATVGVAVGIAIIFMGFDLWTGGKLTAAIRPARILASVTDLPVGEADDNSA